MHLYASPTRGLSKGRAIAYLGISRAQFEANWEPHLCSQRSGGRKLFDQVDIDRLFDIRQQQPVSAYTSAGACTDVPPTRVVATGTGVSTQSKLDNVMRRCLRAGHHVRTAKRPRQVASTGTEG